MPSREAGRKFIENCNEKIERSGYGRYLISLNPTDVDSEESAKRASILPFSKREHVLVGIVTMLCGRFAGAPTIPDLGFGLLPEYFRKGYATEASQGLLKYFEEEKGQKAVSGFCGPENEASKKVLRRLGFEERGVRDLRGILGEGEGNIFRVVVWTKGVGEGDGELEKWGL
jgi:RimJ/RimL family protein N-acetyltransferase